jgi:hypothetical protein
MVLRGYCAGTFGTMRPRRNAFSSNELLHIEASFVPVQWTLPSDQGHRNKLPISMDDTQPFPSYRTAAFMQRYEDRNMRMLDGWGLYCGEGLDRRSLGASGGKLTVVCTRLHVAFRSLLSPTETSSYGVSRRLHAVVTLSRPSRAGCRSFGCCGNLGCVSRWACGVWSSWALRGAWPDCRESAKSSHASANQRRQAHGHVGRYSLRLCRGFPSRPTRRAYAKLSGR